MWHHLFPIQLSNSPPSRRHSRRLANAPPPGFLDRRRDASAVEIRHTSKRTEGARDARGPERRQACASAQTKLLGPTDLDASRHRGLSKSELPQVRQTADGVPRAVFLRFAPRSPRQSVVHDLPFENQALGRHSPDRRIRPTGHQGPRRNVDAPGLSRLGPLGPRCRISDTRDQSPGHRSPPRVWRR